MCLSLLCISEGAYERKRPEAKATKAVTTKMASDVESLAYGLFEGPNQYVGCPTYMWAPLPQFRIAWQHSLVEFANDKEDKPMQNPIRSKSFKQAEQAVYRYNDTSRVNLPSKLKCYLSWPVVKKSTTCYLLRLRDLRAVEDYMYNFDIRLVAACLRRDTTP